MNHGPSVAFVSTYPITVPVPVPTPNLATTETSIPLLGFSRLNPSPTLFPVPHHIPSLSPTHPSLPPLPSSDSYSQHGSRPTVPTDRTRRLSSAGRPRGGTLEGGVGGATENLLRPSDFYV